MVIEDHMQDFWACALDLTAPSGILWSFLKENTKGDVAAQGNAAKDASNQMPSATKMQYW
jgi:hypothetical protein